MPRINKMNDLLSIGQPVYYTQTEDFTYENGRAMASTWADIIRLNLEHGPFDMAGVRAFMRGLADEGPTKSGHLTPTIIAELPVDGINRNVMEANAWMIKQVLACGVHGILLCHTETQEAAKVLVEHSRMPFQEIGVGRGIDQGRRGHGGQSFASQVWGISEDEYLACADLWPLNPDGELIVGVKIENIRGLGNTETILSQNGISFTEWGPGDMSMSLGHRLIHDPPYPDEMLKIRSRVLAAAKKNDLFFLNAVYSEQELLDNLNDGTMIMRISDDDTTGQLADFGRAHTKRPEPW